MKQNYSHVTRNLSLTSLLQGMVTNMQAVPKAMFILLMALFSSFTYNVNAQSTINTVVSGTGYNGNNSSGTNGFITFVVANNSGAPIKITEVGNWATTAHNNTTSTLWYSATSLSGAAAPLATPTWTSIASNVVTGVTTTGVFPVLPGLSFQIPAGAVYRFAVHTTGTNHYTLGTPTPNNFTTAGVTLYTGNHQINGSNVGYAVGNNPRFFSGSIKFEPAITAPDNAGLTRIVSPSPVFCAGSNQTIQVELVNSGTQTLTSARVVWELDNIAQTSFNWTGSLATGAKATITLGTNIPFGTAPRRIKAWSTLPNNKADTVNTDDTLDIGMRAGLSGVYVVGPTGDFTSVAAAANALNTFGVCGAVTMDIIDGNYNGQVALKQISGASAVNTITFKSQSGNANNVIIAASPAGASHVFQLKDASYVTLKNLTLQSNSINAGRVLDFTGAISYDSVLNCKVISTGVSSSTDASGIYGTAIAGGNNVFLNNTVTRGYYGIYWQGVSTAVAGLTKDNIFDNNIINDAYLYSSYFNATSNLKFRNNTIRAINSPTTHYGIFGTFNDNALELIKNDIVITGPGQKTGIHMETCDGTVTSIGVILNNAIAIDCGTSTGFGINSNTSSYQNFINNSVSISSTSTASYAGRFNYTSTAHRNNNIVNNALSNVTGSGYTLYVQNPNTTFNNYYDYNNIHNGTNKYVQRGTPATTYNTLEAWNIASGYDINSISYDPGFVSLTDVHPDPNKPASWSLNGRGLHIPDNVVDFNGNNRPVNRADGVPDIGAFEFTPDAIPPVATATPSIADPGDTQVFTFGQRKVATIKWGTKALVAPLEIRQYSGAKGNGVVTAANPFGTMYYHTDIEALGTLSTFDYDMELNYMDIWLGDIANENELRLAQRVPSYPWMVYSNPLSAVNTTTNVINATQLNRFGSFTGLENGSVPSAFVRPQGRNIFCVGSTVLLRAEPQPGDFYKWYLNGTEIPGASGTTNNTYTATQAGQYSVAITFGSKIVESVPVAISTVAPPNAVVVANGPLTYCTGNGLVLNAGNTTGVTYQWQLGGTNIPGATGNTYPVSQAGDYTVMVENIGCATTSSTTKINAGPLNVSLGDDTTYCEIKNVYAKLDAGYPGATYMWNTGETTQTIEVKQQGTYWVTVDAGPNCMANDTIEVTIDQLPQANGISFVQNGNDYQFFPSGPVGVSGFMWLFSDGTTSIDANPTKTITGDLYVRLVLFNGCGTDTVQLGWPLTVKNTVKEDAVVIFPNPATDNISIRIDGTVTLQQITILNSVGAVVSQNDNIDGKQQHTINIAQLPAGQYMLRARTADGVVNKQFNIIR